MHVGKKGERHETEWGEQQRSAISNYFSFAVHHDDDSGAVEMKGDTMQKIFLLTDDVYVGGVLTTGYTMAFKTKEAALAHFSHAIQYSVGDEEFRGGESAYDEDFIVSCETAAGFFHSYTDDGITCEWEITEMPLFE